MLNNSWLRFGTSSHRISEVTTSPQHHFSHKHGALLSRRHGSANSTMLKLLQKLGPGASEAWLIFCFDLLKTSSDHWSVSWYLSFQNMGNPRNRYLWRIRYTLFFFFFFVRLHFKVHMAKPFDSVSHWAAWTSRQEFSFSHQKQGSAPLCVTTGS